MMTATEFFTKTDPKALTEKLNAANGRATARTLDIDACIEHLTDFENSLRVSKKAMTGKKATVHATMETLPGAYRYRYRGDLMTRFENGEYTVMYYGIVTVSDITRGKRTASCTVTDGDGREHRAEIRRGSGEELLCFTGRNGLCYIVSSDNKKKER